MSEHLKRPNKVAKAAAEVGVGVATIAGFGGAAGHLPPPPTQRPPAAVAEVTLAPDGGILEKNSPTKEPKPKQEYTVTVPGTDIAFGVERDNNGTLNTGSEGEEPGTPARELIPDVMPNFVIGSSNPQGGTLGDGWRFQKVDTSHTVQAPVPTQEPTYTEETEEVTDISKHPITTPWEEDYQASPELTSEVRGAVQECFGQVQQRQELGYLLTGIQIGGLSSDEGNAENPGDPMANLGQHSKLNQELANQRGLAGLQTAQQLGPQNGIDPSLIQFLEGQEVLASPQEIEQIAGYAKLLGQDPLSLIQDYNRARTEGLQPLMDELFKGNRGIICIANYTKTETSIVQGPDKKTVVLVPVEIKGKSLQWRIEIPGEILLLPLLYIALKAGIGAIGSAGGGGLPFLPKSPTTPLGPSSPPAGAGPTPPARRTKPNPPKPLKPKLDPLEFVPLTPLYPTKNSKFKNGEANTGLQNPQNPIQRIKQPRPHNFHGAGARRNRQPMGRSRGGNRSGKRTGSGR